MVNGFVSAIFIKTINCVGEPLDCHLKNANGVHVHLNIHNNFLNVAIPIACINMHYAWRYQLEMVFKRVHNVLHRSNCI